MRAMLLDAPGGALRRADLAPRPRSGELLLEVAASGSRTDLHIVDGELSDPALPLVPGHQIVARVLIGRRALRARRPRGGAVARLDLRRSAVAAADAENLCDRAVFTGYTRPGG